MTYPAQIGRYRITSEIGRGAMGAVLRAVDPALDRTVAVKIIAPQGRHAIDQELIARFIREAKLAARINHPGVVTVHDAGQEGDQLYLVMELVEGESLRERLLRGEYPDRSEALDLVAEVADALAAAHALGVVHRDVKPANILLTRQGRVKVTDFGVAKGIGDETEVTREGATVGSPSYMAPEQVMGRKLDGRADLFSLGVVLFELLMRRRPFPAETITTLVYQILNTDPLADEATVRNLDAPTVDLLRACLAKDPSKRIGDAGMLAARARDLARQCKVPDDTVPALALADQVKRVTAAAETVADVPLRSMVPPPVPSATLTPTVVTPAQAAALPPTMVTPVTATAPPARAASRALLWMLAAAGIGVCALLVVLSLAVGRWRRVPPAMAAALSKSAQPATAVPGQPAAVVPGQPAAVVPAPPTPTHPSPAVQLPATPAPQAAMPAAQPNVARPQPTAVRAVASPVIGRTQAVLPTPVVSVPVLPTPLPPTPLPQPTPTPPIVETYSCKEGAEFHVSPEDLKIEVNGQLIGIADDWDGMGGGKAYIFPREGTYYVRLSFEPKWEPAWIKIVVSPNAEDKIVNVGTELKKAKKPKP